MRRIGAAGHVYYISFGQGKLVGHDSTCQNCQTTYEADPSLYRSVAQQRPFSLTQLAQQTLPNYQQIYAERLELEKNIRFNPFSLNEQDRARLLYEPFWLLSPKLEQHSGILRLDWNAALALCALLLAFICVPLLAAQWQLEVNNMLFLLLCVVGVVLITWQHFSSSSRFAQLHLLPQLARTLSPLRPTDEEIHHVLDDLKQRGMTIGKKIKPDALIEALKNAKFNPDSAQQAPIHKP